MSVRVVVVDDHPVFRLGLRALLGSLEGIEVVGEADSVEAARAVLGDSKPDVAIIDVHLPDGSGIELMAELVRTQPSCGVLALTMSLDDDIVVSAVRAGARSYLVKGAEPDTVERAVRGVAAGEVVLDSAIAARTLSLLQQPSLVPAFPQLTPREREVLDLMARELDNAAIGRRLYVSQKTVRNAVSLIVAKIHAEDRADAIRRAREAGLGTP